MEVHPGVFVSSTSTDAWRSDPEVGGGAEEHELPQTEVILVLEGGVKIEIEGGPCGCSPAPSSPP
jgi:hypothetical protein